MAGRDPQYPPTSAPVLSPHRRSWKGGKRPFFPQGEIQESVPGSSWENSCVTSAEVETLTVPRSRFLPPSEMLLRQQQHIKRQNKAALLWLQRLRRCQECENASRGNSFFSRKDGEGNREDFLTHFGQWETNGKRSEAADWSTAVSIYPRV